MESLALSAALVSLLSFFAMVIYFSLVHAGMNYLLHEHLVCEQTEHHGDCTSNFKSRAQAWLFMAKLRSFQSTQTSSKIRDRLQIQMPLQRKLTLTKEMPVLR
jgi:hypothetical protein